MLNDHDIAVAVARAAHEGSGLPVTVKLRSGQRKGDTSGVELAHRLVDEAGVAGDHASTRARRRSTTRARPTSTSPPSSCASCRRPVILSGGMNEPAWIVDAWDHTGAEAIMLARGALGNPWLFARLLGARGTAPASRGVLDELDWVMDRAVEHLGADRAGRYLRKFYPWYVDRLGRDAGPDAGEALQRSLQTTTVDEARAVLAVSERPAAA